MKLFISCFFSLHFFLLFSQDKKPFVITQKDTFLTITEKYIRYFNDYDKKYSFDEIRKINFSDTALILKNHNGFFWRKFLISPKNTGKYLTVFLKTPDIATVFIPLKNGMFKEEKIGLVSGKKAKHNINLKNISTTATDSIDWFYYKFSGIV